MKDRIEDFTISRISEDAMCYSISTNSSGFVLYKKYNVVPKIGDVITLYCKGFAHIRGMDINGTKIFYKTDEELEAHRVKELAKIEQRQRDEFERSKSQLDAQYESLPNCFKQRIDKFRTNNPEFRVHNNTNKSMKMYVYLCKYSNILMFDVSYWNKNIFILIVL